MKYTILGFSQEVSIKYKLDMDKLLILRYLVDFSHTKKMTKTTVEGREFYWVNYDSMIEALPILSIKKDTVYRKLKEMVATGVLTHHTIKNAGIYSFYGFGENYPELIGEKSEGSDKNPEGYGEKSVTHTDKNPEQKINLLKDTSIKDNNKNKQKADNQDLTKYLDYIKTKFNKEVTDKNILQDLEKIIKDNSLDDLILVTEHILNDEWHKKEKCATIATIARTTKFGAKLEKARLIAGATTQAVAQQAPVPAKSCVWSKSW